MQPIRYSINVSLDGCVDHTADFAVGPEVHQHAADWVARNDVLVFGRVTFELMEAWRPDEQGRFADWIEPWMEPFARTIGATPKVVVSDTLEPGASQGWNTEVVPVADLAATVRRLREQPGRGVGVGGVVMPLELARLGLIDEYQLVVHPVVVGHGPYLFGGLDESIALDEIDRVELPGGVVAVGLRPSP